MFGKEAGKRIAGWAIVALLLAFVLSSGSAYGQPQQTVNMNAPPPQAVVQAGGVYTGQIFSGSQPVCYFIVARYPIGATPPYGPVCVPNSPGVVNLSATKYITINWQGTGATTYDVIRSTSSSYPVPCSGCAVGVGLTTTLLVDNGLSGVAYPNAGYVNAVQANANLYIDNQSAAVPKVMQNLNGTVTQVGEVVGSPTAGNCAQYNANGQLVDAGTTCGSSAGAVTTGVPLTVGLPVIGAGGGAVAIGSRQGNTTQYVSRGAVVPGTSECANWDASGNISSSGAPCAVTAFAPVVSSTFAARGACNSGREGQMAVFTDSVIESICLSAAWVNSYANRRLTLPSIAGTWVNQGTSTLTNTGGVAVLSAQSGGGGNNIRGQFFSTPATPYTISLRFVISGLMLGYDTCGLYLRQSSDGKLIALTNGIREGGSGQVVGYAVQKFTNVTTFSANYGASPWYGQVGTYSVLSAVQVVDDGVNRTFQVSQDGVNWSTLATNGRTDFLTADQYGYACDAHGSGDALVGLFYSLTVQ